MPKFVNLRLASFATLAVLGVAASMHAQQSTPPASNGRKVVARVAPEYPPLAVRMHIEGIVRVEASVRPNGSVKSTRILGGNPVLVDAAQIAVGKWKFEPSQAETVEIVQVTFASR
jgi:TonB family protein